MKPSQATLKAQYYRALPIDQPGREAVELDIDVARTALIGMHCWNIGCPDGPDVNVDYCVGMGWPQSTDEAARIMADVIRPSMDLARRVGMAICHVETDWMDGQYPDLDSRRDRKTTTPIRKHEQQRILDRAHGPNYLADSPLRDMKRAEIVAPVGDEPMFFYTDNLDAYLTERNIDTLIYMGFATDMCILGAEGGARPMLSRGYRCVLMRDATVGVETPESFPERLSTRYGIHLFEWSVGYSTTYSEFVSALG